MRLLLIAAVLVGAAGCSGEPERAPATTPPDPGLDDVMPAECGDVYGVTVRTYLENICFNDAERRDRCLGLDGGLTREELMVEAEPCVEYYLTLPWPCPCELLLATTACGNSECESDRMTSCLAGHLSAECRSLF